MPVAKAARGWNVMAAKGSWVEGGLLAGRAGWACYRYAARGRDISLLARSDHDAVLDLPPFEKVWTRPAALARKL